MRKIILVFLLVLILGLPILAFAAAANCEEYCANPSLGQPPNQVCICNPVTAISFEALADNIINFFWWFSLAVVPIVIIIAGYYFVTSMGDPQKVSTAKKIILYALIGFLVIACAKGIVALLRSIM